MCASVMRSAAMPSLVRRSTISGPPVPASVWTTTAAPVARDAAAMACKPASLMLAWAVQRRAALDHAGPDARAVHAMRGCRRSLAPSAPRRSRCRPSRLPHSARRGGSPWPPTIVTPVRTAASRSSSGCRPSPIGVRSTTAASPFASPSSSSATARSKSSIVSSGWAGVSQEKVLVGVGRAEVGRDRWGR